MVDEDALREYEKQKDGTVGMEEDQNSDDGLGYDDDDDDLWEEDDERMMIVWMANIDVQKASK